MATELKSAYLFTGDDDVKIDQARARLIARAKADGAPLEQLKDAACTPENFAMALVSPTLLPGRRIVLADGIETWMAGNVGPAADALQSLAGGQPDVTAVLICRKKPLKAITDGVAAAGGEQHDFKQPPAKQLPQWLASQATELGVEIDPAAANLLVSIVGEPAKQASAAQRFVPKRRLLAELQKLATMVGPGQTIGVDDVRQAAAGEASPTVFAMTDAAVGGNRKVAIGLAGQLIASGEPAPRIVALLARAFGQSQQAAALIESGRGSEVAAALKLPPWLANKLAEQSRSRGSASLRDALIEIAQLDSAVKGGSALDNETELVRSIARISG